MRAKVAFCSEAPGMALEEDGYASVLMVLIAQGGRGLQTTVHYKRKKSALQYFRPFLLHFSAFFFTALPLAEEALPDSIALPDLAWPLSYHM